MTTTRLTPQQLAQFDTFGYLGFPGLLADRAQGIIDAYHAVWDAHGGGHNGKPHDGKARSVVVQFLDQSAYLSTLLDDPRIHPSSLEQVRGRAWTKIAKTTPCKVGRSPTRSTRAGLPGQVRQ